MLISLSKKFVFVANLKTASTSIEKLLHPHCEIALTRSEYGKHMRLYEVASRFDWLFKHDGLKKFYVFGVIRNPIDYALSVYNSHHGDRFKDSPRLTTQGVTFTQFLDTWTKANRDQMAPQYTRFVTADGRLGTNLLISHRKVKEGIALVTQRFGLRMPGGLPKENSSEKVLTKDDLNEDELAWLRVHFAEDFNLLRQYCDQEYSEEELSALSWHAPTHRAPATPVTPVTPAT